MRTLRNKEQEPNDHETAVEKDIQVQKSSDQLHSPRIGAVTK